MLKHLSQKVDIIVDGKKIATIDLSNTRIKERPRIEKRDPDPEEGTPTDGKDC